MQRSWPRACRPQSARGRFVEGRMDAAREHAFIKPCPFQHLARHRDVALRARVRRPRKCQMTVVECQRASGARLDQRQCLQRLDRGTGINWYRDVTECDNDMSVRVCNGNAATMRAFDELSARDLDEDRISHPLCRAALLAIRWGPPLSAFGA